MPFLQVPPPAGGEGAAPVTLYYRLHGTMAEEGGQAFVEDSRPKVLMLMGFAATHQMWACQLADLLTSKGGEAEAPMCVCVVDNRGVGRSSSPPGRHQYRTEIMAQDALHLMDHLGWQRFHVAGHSMGAMIACKLAAAAPARVASLALLSATGGRWQAVPQSLRSLWLGVKLLLVRGPRERASVDVQFHFSASLLEEVDPETQEPRRDALVEEYVEAAERARARAQPQHGMRGQLAAVFRHRLRRRDVAAIQSGQFPVLVLHGRQDIVALPRYGERLAARLQAPFVALEGGHFVMREQAAAVNHLLRALVMGKSFANVERYPYMPFHHWVAAVARHRQRPLGQALGRGEDAEPGQPATPAAAAGAAGGALITATSTE